MVKGKTTRGGTGTSDEGPNSDLVAYPGGAFVRLHQRGETVEHLYGQQLQVSGDLLVQRAIWGSTPRASHRMLEPCALMGYPGAEMQEGDNRRGGGEEGSRRSGGKEKQKERRGEKGRVKRRKERRRRGYGKDRVRRNEDGTQG